jgi:hypothetical protein
VALHFGFIYAREGAIVGGLRHGGAKSGGSVILRKGATPWLGHDWAKVGCTG